MKRFAFGTLLAAVCATLALSAASAQTLVVKNNGAPAAGVNVMALALMGKAGPGGTATTDNNGNASGVTSSLPSGTHVDVFVCPDGKTVKLVPPGANPDDVQPPCPGRKRIGGFVIGGGGTVTVDVGTGTVVTTGGGGGGIGGGASIGNWWQTPQTNWGFQPSFTGGLNLLNDSYSANGCKDFSGSGSCSSDGHVFGGNFGGAFDFFPPGNSGIGFGALVEKSFNQGFGFNEMFTGATSFTDVGSTKLNQFGWGAEGVVRMPFCDRTTFNPQFLHRTATETSTFTSTSGTGSSATSSTGTSSYDGSGNMWGGQILFGLTPMISVGGGVSEETFHFKSMTTGTGSSTTTFTPPSTNLWEYRAEVRVSLNKWRF